MDRKFLSRLTFKKGNSTIERFIYRNGTDSRLYKSLSDFDNNISFPVEASETSYKGCGIKSAQNVLRYFDIFMTQDELKKYIPTHSLPGTDSIWSYPDEMVSKLQKILNDKGYNGVITVIRHEGKHNDKNFVLNMLKSGFPLIALVDKGYHYISVVGYQGSIYYVHNNWNESKLNKIDTSFGPGAKFVNFIASNIPFFDDNKFKEGTFITFHGGSIDVPHVKLWIDADYKKGPFFVSENISNFKDYGINDNISSINVPAGMKAVLYEHSNYQGKSIEIYEDVANFKNIGFNDMASSIKISSVTPADIPRVQLWIDADYKKGPFFVSGDIPDFRAHGINDSISSINVPAGMKAVLYEHSNYQGKSIEIYEDVANFKNIGFNDMASSIKISSVTPADIPRVQLWIDANYKKGPFFVSGDIPDFRAHGINDSISSINIPKGIKVILYQDINYKGKSITLSGDVPNLKNIGFNDTASSLKIIKA